MRKKGQEEIVGFVLIVLIVSVILLVFLGIFLRKDVSKTANPEVSQFLDSMSAITTECSLNAGYSYENYQDLLKDCNEGKLCASGKACDILKNTTKSLIEASWNFSPDSPKKGYKFEVYFTAREETAKQPLINPPLSYISGCTSFIGDERVFPVSDGSITILLDLCLN